MASQNSYCNTVKRGCKIKIQTEFVQRYLQYCKIVAMLLMTPHFYLNSIDK